MRMASFCYCAAATIFVTAMVGQGKGAELVGYLPDYRMGWESSYIKNVLPKQLPLLDEIRYFGMETDSNGVLTSNPTHLANINTLKTKIAALPAGQRPRLTITLGGWGKSTGFGPVASDPTKRQALADNLNSFLNAHQLDGVDLDWEHPAAGTQLTGDYPALISTIKQTLGSGLRVSAAVAPSKILPGSVFEGPNAIDSVALMTYDLAWWSSDGRGPHSPQQYAVDALDAWTDDVGTPITQQPKVFGGMTSVGAPEDRLGVGIPFYGRGIEPSWPGWAVEYSTLHNNGTTTDGNTYSYSTGTFWITGPDLVAERVGWANQRGVHEIIMWELWHDLDPDHADSLLRAAYSTNTVPEPSTLLLAAGGLLCLAFYGWRRKW